MSKTCVWVRSNVFIHFYWPFQGGNYFVDLLCYLCLVFAMLLRLFIAALWSPERKVLLSWLLFVMFIVFLLLYHLVSWDRCRAWLCRFLILAVFLISKSKTHAGWWSFLLLSSIFAYVLETYDLTPSWADPYLQYQTKLKLLLFLLTTLSKWTENSNSPQYFSIIVHSLSLRTQVVSFWVRHYQFYLMSMFSTSTNKFIPHLPTLAWNIS